MRKLTPFTLLLCLLIAVLSQAQPSTIKLSIPLGGNSWLTTAAVNGREELTEEGWQNWSGTGAKWSTWVWLSKPGTLKVSAVMELPQGSSRIACRVNGKGFVASPSGNRPKEYQLGQWNIPRAGHVRIEMQGLSRTGPVFAKIGSLNISGTAVDNNAVYVRDNDDNYFYWGRRGPSAHLRYNWDEVGEDIEWFYSEITVPPGMDPAGSYFMANGFGEGYFGIQVNSATERRVLFSVWSPFNTDNPAAIPADKKIMLLKKGEGVQTGEFGNEGSGGQSFLRYNWKAGTTYKFLLRGAPAANNYTHYSAWFFATDQNRWLFIASFARPATQTWLRDLYSFIENFNDNQGNLTRKAWYHNQWARTKAGNWKPLNKVEFTGDQTAEKKFRMDYSGGTEGNRFFLRNGGFFNDHTPLNKEFSLPTSSKAPDIMLSDFRF